MINYNKNGLDSREYEHVLDREALAALKKIPYLDKVLGVYMDFVQKSSAGIEAKLDNFRVTAKSYPKLYGLYQRALDRLNMDTEPELYLYMSHSYNAMASGAKKNMVRISSSCIQNMTDNELLFVMGHELGHVKSDHLVYRNLAESLNIIPKLLGNKIANYVSGGLDFAIMDWSRKSEYTADRAGMIAADGYENCKNAFLKLMGMNNTGGKVCMLSDEDILRQHAEFESVKNNVIGKLMYVTQTALSTHPWMIDRFKMLSEWEKSGEYAALAGKYGL